MKTTLFCLAAWAFAAGAIAQDTTHPFSVHDMLAMQRISDAQVSPDGRWVLFTLRTTDLDANRGRTDLWMCALDGSDPRQLTTNEASDFNGRWQPNGHGVMFLSTRSGSSQIWRMSIHGGEATQLSDFPIDVGTFEVFPEGKKFALAMEVYADAETLEDTVARDAEIEQDPRTGRVYDELLFRHWDTWEDGKRSHVFVWQVGGEPVDLMRGIDADCPTRPFGGSEEIAIAPDGSELTLAYKNNAPKSSWTTDVNLWRVPADGSAAPELLTADNEALDSTPVYSPDGKWLAYGAMQRPGYESDRVRIMLRDRASGETRALTERWDRSASGITFSADGKTIFTSAADLGNRSIFAVDAESGNVERLAGNGYNTSPQFVPAEDGARLIFSHDTLRSPVELYSMALDGSDIRKVTDINAERVAAARMGEYEQFTFEGAASETVYGYVVKPADFVEGEKYPVAFLIHGGPQGSFGNHFHYRWNPQAYAGAGYAAVFIDFHGSTGYGQAFTDSINQDWGGKPFQDLMKGLDAALEMYPFLDGERVGALGASYGGYMINWIAGQTDRFECLVNHDGVFDLRSMYFSTEEQWFVEWDLGGVPWAAPDNFARFNPAQYVQNWKTPILVIQGALDFRVVETQAFGAFTAAQRQGVASRLLYFPDENHWVLKPHNSIQWHETVLDWLDQWTRE